MTRRRNVTTIMSSKRKLEDGDAQSPCKRAKVDDPADHPSVEIKWVPGGSMHSFVEDVLKQLSTLAQTCGMRCQTRLLEEDDETWTILAIVADGLEIELKGCQGGGRSQDCFATSLVLGATAQRLTGKLGWRVCFAPADTWTMQATLVHTLPAGTIRVIGQRLRCVPALTVEACYEHGSEQQAKFLRRFTRRVHHIHRVQGNERYSREHPLFTMLVQLVKLPDLTDQRAHAFLSKVFRQDSDMEERLRDVWSSARNDFFLHHMLGKAFYATFVLCTTLLLPVYQDAWMFRDTLADPLRILLSCHMMPKEAVVAVLNDLRVDLTVHLSAFMVDEEKRGPQALCKRIRATHMLTLLEWAQQSLSAEMAGRLWVTACSDVWCRTQLDARILTMCPKPRDADLARVCRRFCNLIEPDVGLLQVPDDGEYNIRRLAIDRLFDVYDHFGEERVMGALDTSLRLSMRAILVEHTATRKRYLESANKQLRAMHWNIFGSIRS